MKPSQKPSHRRPACFALAAFAAAMLFAAPAAHAFTYETKNYTDGADSSVFLDPDKKVEQFGSGTVQLKPNNGVTLNFEVKPYNNGIVSPLNDRFGPASKYIPVPGMGLQNLPD
jgi:hypothetical protein